MIKKLLTLTMALSVALLLFGAGPANAQVPEGPAWIYMGSVAEYDTPQANPITGQPTANYLGQCNTNNLYCAWTGANWTGDFYKWNTVWNNTCVPTSGLMNDSITSFWNNMPSFKAELFIDGGCKNPPSWGGANPIFAPGTYTTNLDCGIPGCWNYNNAVSSFKTHL